MKIRYRTRHGMAEWVYFEDCECDTLTLLFEPHHSGVLLLGGKILTVKDGEVSISKSALSDGKYTPRLESEDGVYTVEGFTKSGDTVSLDKADEKLVRALLLRCYNLEDAVSSLEEKVAALEKVCHGHKIFDFERKDT